MDLNHLIGGDLNVSPTGDLSLVSGDTETQQRILRRLLTNVGGYIWHLDYGAGVSQFVGSNINARSAKGAISSSLALEDSVAKSPAPIITVTPIDNGLFCSIQYWTSANKTPFTLSFNVSQ